MNNLTLVEIHTSVPSFSQPNISGLTETLNPTAAFNVSLDQEYVAFYQDSDNSLSLYSADFDSNGNVTCSLAAKNQVPHTLTILKPFKLGGQQFLVGYNTAESYIHYYQLNADLTLSTVYEGYVGAGFSMIQPMSYRNSVYVVMYSFDTGNVHKYQLFTPAETPLYPQSTWSDIWAKEWTRFAFFQFGGENFFIKTNLAHKKVNIDHFMDDASEGSHPVLNMPAPSEMLNASAVVSFENEEGHKQGVLIAENACTLDKMHAVDGAIKQANLIQKENEEITEAFFKTELDKKPEIVQIEKRVIEYVEKQTQNNDVGDCNLDDDELHILQDLTALANQQAHSNQP